jgi:hypothetical protein
MDPLVLPLIRSTYDERSFIKIVKETVDMQLSSGLSGQDSRFLSMVVQWCYDCENELQCLRESGNAATHLFFGFLIICDYECLIELLQHHVGKITSTATIKTGTSLLIMSGTLDEWRNSIVRLSIRESDRNVRLVMNRILAYFDSIDLGQVFISYRRVQLKDGTKLLEAKP